MISGQGRRCLASTAFEQGGIFIVPDPSRELESRLFRSHPKDRPVLSTLVTFGTNYYAFGKKKKVT